MFDVVLCLCTITTCYHHKIFTFSQHANIMLTQIVRFSEKSKILNVYHLGKLFVKNHKTTENWAQII